MKLSEAVKKFASKARLESVKSVLADSSVRRARFSGLAGSAPAMLLAALPKSAKALPIIVVGADPEDAAYLHNDLAAIAGQDAVALLPGGYKRHIRYGQPDPAAQVMRTEALAAISDKRTRWIVTSPEGLAEKVPRPENLASETIEIKKGRSLDIPELVNRLLEMGFCKTDYVYEPGQFAHRGSIVDIFSYSCDMPYRLDFFDDEVDSIRTFNVETQLSDGQPDQITILPSATDVAKGPGMSLLEWFEGSKNLLWCRSVSSLKAGVEAICATVVSESVALSGEGDADAAKSLVDFPGFAAKLEGMRVVEFGVGSDSGRCDAAIDFGCSPQSLYHKNFELIAESFSNYIKEGFALYVLSDSPEQGERLRTIFAERGDGIAFTPVEPTLHAGFIDPASKCCFLTDHQIFDRFHRYKLRSDKARGGKVAMSLKELARIETGDYIVHVDHGIGRFAGLVRMPTPGGAVQEMVKLVYQNDDTLFVNIHSLHKLSKYRGSEGVAPKINKLGSGAWNRLKERTKAKVKDIARDLIKLYAARREEKGFPFSPDTYMQHELEASFVYEDTPDQLKAVAAVKADMESPRPMDRLVCGDVGFGKTEIAIRAAFKAAADSKQTAVLVPTTVLASQHYQTFSQRLKDFPVRVEYLSRARKPKEVKQILADLADGKIDILVGTHKMIGKSVKFKDLGLLIVDEEQKFGVAVKEKLKQLKVNVDTLTMSATPIPRTLQFSLMGARDLSNLNTPPANRRPIETQVAPFSEETIAEAIGFELSRGGQVFFIANRIERLETLQNTIARLMPDARVVIGHGQLPPEELERRICDFQEKNYDVLLATTIVENGVDMPNVNTIIVDSAQNFGLSELHQLRGRVGRSSRKAFCYLLTPPGMPLTPIARRRLQAIESFSDLGAGIHIAMQDLDIRGAGNLLGAEQSGFIADLGYETYQKILKESVIELKTNEFGDTFTDLAAGKEEEFVADCTVETDMELMLPASYVPLESERISLYQQLDNMETAESVEKFRAMMRDRFGEIPHKSDELINVVLLRMEAKRLGIERVLLKDGKMHLYFVGDENKAYYGSSAFGRILAYLQINPRLTSIRERNGKRSVIVDKTDTVASALERLRTMRALPPVGS